MSTLDFVNGICIQAGHVGALWENKLYVFGGTVWLTTRAEEGRGISNEHLRVVDFTKDADVAVTRITTATRINNPSVAPSKWLSFFAHAGKLRGFGGEPEFYSTLNDEGQPPANTTKRPGLTGMQWGYDIPTAQWSARNATGIPLLETPASTQVAVDKANGVGWVYGGAYADNGYMMGGVRTNASGFGALWLDKMYKYDLASDRVELVEKKGVNSPGPNSAGAMEFIPGLGGQGVLVLFGGVMGPNDRYRTLEMIHIYDIATATWYVQRTTAELGDFPEVRNRFCTVSAAAADNSSFNIFVYGGLNGPAESIALRSMYILTIPGFHWINIGNADVAKASLSCHKLQERYLLAYRGRPVDRGCDVNQGIRLFDMTTLKWTAKYEVSKEANPKFKLPADLTKVIGGNADGGAKFQRPRAGAFDDERLEAIFSPMFLPNDTTVTPTNSTNNPIETGGKEIGDSDGDSKSSVGAIVGGVIGGLVVLALLVLAYFWFRRRGKKAVPPGAGGMHNNTHEIGVSATAQWGGNPGGHPYGHHDPYAANPYGPPIPYGVAVGNQGITENYGAGYDSASKPLAPRELNSGWQPTELEGGGRHTQAPVHEMYDNNRHGSPQPTERLMGGH